ncbi:hypothetical protein ACFCWY_08665 [Streptomyces sp. NPDC056362]|uniref:hypothetical protein n=1 Tax=unclassified Streptomyces TaxID=2593676 RepID=UPI0035DFFBBB
MHVLLLGRWNDYGHLVIEDSQEFEGSDDAAMAAAVDEQDNEGYMAWAASFEVVDFPDVAVRHRDAIDQAFAEYVREENSEGDPVGGLLVDKTTGLRHT